jgi:transposase
MNFQVDSLLNLPGITVETCSHVEDNIGRQLQVLSSGINGSYGQKYIEQLHQHRPILVRDLPRFGKAVYLRVILLFWILRLCNRSFRIYLNLFR